MKRRGAPLTEPQTGTAAAGPQVPAVAVAFAHVRVTGVPEAPPAHDIVHLVPILPTPQLLVYSAPKDKAGQVISVYKIPQKIIITGLDLLYRGNN